MSIDVRTLEATFTAPTPSQRLHNVVLRLVRTGPERRAVAAGEADAILDPESGDAFLLPAAQRWLLECSLRQGADDAAADSLSVAAIDGLAVEIGVLDARGDVLSTNRAWRNAAPLGLGAGLSEGLNYLAACDTATGDDRIDGLALAAGVRQVIAGERALFRYEYSCDGPQGRCWFAFSVTPAAGDTAARAIVLREDITGRKREEQLLGLEHTVARALADADGTATALRAVMQAVCESLGWDCGRVFLFDPDAAVLRFRECWGRPTPAIERFLALSRDLLIRPGAGLKGRVYRSGEPLWIVAGQPDDGLSAAALAPDTGTEGAFIFPVTGGGATLGVLAFSGRGIHEPCVRMLQAVRVIGSQVGRYLLQQQALEALRCSEARFRRLTEFSTDWYWQQDRDGRFTEYVGSGIAGAGEVLGKRLVDLPGVSPGDGDWAGYEAQVAERWSFCDYEFTARRADGRLARYSISGEPMFDEAGVFTGYSGTGTDITARRQG